MIDNTDTLPLAYSIIDAARKIGISRSGLSVIIHRGEIPIIKIGNRTLILEEDLKAYLLSCRVTK